MMEEQELATRCARKDKGAREELFRRYGSRLFALCLRYSSNRNEADDLFQDAFIRIYDRIGRFRWQGGGSLFRWMARLTLNMHFDKARRRRLYQETDIGPYEETLPEPDYEETLQVPQEVLTEMIGRLPERYRTVFQLYCIEGLSHVEIARLLGIKEKSSSADLARARALLSRQIKQYLNDD
jgi:RNA polymerase sigma-70 factor (ECF subfamily)